jgi:hypothetical protein
MNDEKQPSDTDVFLGQLYDMFGLFGAYVLLGVVIAVLIGLFWLAFNL